MRLALQGRNRIHKRSPTGASIRLPLPRYPPRLGDLIGRHLGAAQWVLRLGANARAGGGGGVRRALPEKRAGRRSSLSRSRRPPRIARRMPWRAPHGSSLAAFPLLARPHTRRPRDGHPWPIWEGAVAHRDCCPAAPLLRDSALSRADLHAGAKYPVDHLKWQPSRPGPIASPTGVHGRFESAGRLLTRGRASQPAAATKAARGLTLRRVLNSLSTALATSARACSASSRVANDSVTRGRLFSLWMLKP